MKFKDTYFYKVAYFLFYVPKGLYWRCRFYFQSRAEYLRCIWAALKVRRVKDKPFDIGLGPLPMINNVYHKQALVKYGYKTNTFVSTVYHITSEFDFNADKEFTNHQKYRRYFSTWFKYVVNNHKCVYIYFNGCVLGSDPFLSKKEIFLLKLARIKTVVMPYGADIQDFTKSRNLIFRNNMCLDYPKFHLQRKRIRENVDQWTTHADHIISGCDWVEYMYYWDTLMLAHFSIDTEKWKPSATQPERDPNAPLKIFHAPNHVNQKGTKHFVKAVEELKQEGLNIELMMVQRVPNSEIKRLIETADVVADQLVIGWYAMFSLEALSLEKPVLCYLNPDLLNMYIESGLVTKDEIPIINCNPFTVKDAIRNLYENRDKLKDIGKRSREFVLKHHSIEYIGSVFDKINRKIGIEPTGTPKN
jgi:glycosyltransferase involved in cell wall biosynthesis